MFADQPLSERHKVYLSIADLRFIIDELKEVYHETSSERVLRLIHELESRIDQIRRDELVQIERDVVLLLTNRHKFPHAAITWAEAEFLRREG